MFNDLLSDSENTILVARLSRALPKLVAANYATLEEYQSAIYSIVNQVLSLQNTMQPLSNIKAETPAIIGDLTTNITNLNNDAIDTVSQLSMVESDIANLFNLAESSQSTIRQLIRQQIYTNNSTIYSENFIDNINIQSATAELDYKAGIATLPIINRSTISYFVSVGVSSIGSSASSLGSLNDGAIDTTYTWNGNVLELLISFPTAQIINRLVLDLDTYDGLEITALTSSPDGTIYNDILGILDVEGIVINSTSGKYSGAVVIDFPPQYSSTIQLVINNVIGTQTIALRNLTVYSTQYSTSGQLTSTLINNPIGPIKFSSDSYTTDLTNLIHQYSYDNIHFNTLEEGNLTLTQPYWYRALLSRSTSNTATTGLVTDPANSTYYTIVSSTTLNLGSNITERTIVLSSITGPIVLSEVPLPKSLKLQVGSTFLNPTQFSFVNNTITLSSNQSNLTIIYQTAGANAQVLATLQNYYTPILKEYKFEA